MMLKLKRKYCAAALGLGLIFNTQLAQAQITVQANRTALQLAQAITGNGVTVTNATLSCSNTGNGIFRSPNNTVGLDSGIVLSTGNANQLGFAEPGVNSTNLNRSGDTDLTAISGSNTTRDACVLEFDVVPSGDELKFDYVFASEEYVNAVCGVYNDIFAFFISGPGIVGTKNIALVPGTQIPVAVNSVNNGIVGTHAGSNIINCTGMGAGSPFTQYYIDNTGNQFFAYKGYTTVFAARQAVTPCNTYHLKLAIADAGNALYDSGVMIKAGSLSSSSITARVAAPIVVDNLPTAIKGCNAAQIYIEHNQARSLPQNVSLAFGGNAQAGIDYVALNNQVTIPANAINTSFTVNMLNTTNRGDRTLNIYVIDPFNCDNNVRYIDSVTLQLIEVPTVQLLTEDDTICSGVSVQADVRASHDIFFYNWTPNYNINDANIAMPTFTPFIGTTYVMNATIPNSGCPSIKDSLRLDIIAGPQSIAFSQEDITICKGNSVDLTVQVNPSIPGLLYAWSGPQGYTNTSAQLQLYDAQAAQTGWYKVEVTAEGCNTLVDSVFVKIIDEVRSPVLPALQACQDEPINVPYNANGFKWYMNAVGGETYNEMPVLNTSELGTQTIYVSQMVGHCESKRAPVNVNVMKCCENDMFIPNAFTPNDDGLNDMFEIKLDPGSRLNTFQIYDRWGQRVYVNSGADIRWDGTLHRQHLEMGVYYYNMELQCIDGRKVERKGEIHLLR